jgi:hypothetical protein
MQREPYIGGKAEAARVERLFGMLVFLTLMILGYGGLKACAVESGALRGGPALLEK